MMQNTIGPYFNTTLTHEIGIHPNQMNSNIYINLKNNLIEKFQNKCFGSLGYVCKIYGIVDKKGGLITPENPNLPAIYSVVFKCKFCRPIRGNIIIFEVKSINSAIIFLVNGPINCIIFEGNEQINKNNFTFDEKKNELIGHIDNETGTRVVVGTHVKVKCIDMMIQDKTKRIMIIGTLESLATKEEFEKANFERETENDLKYYEYDEYAGFDNNTDNNGDEIGNSESEDIDEEDNKKFNMD